MIRLALIFLLDSTIKVSVLLLIALAAIAVLRRRSAALRHWLLAAAIACAVATPLLESILPAWSLGVVSASALASMQRGSSASTGDARLAVTGDTDDNAAPWRLRSRELAGTAHGAGEGSSLAETFRGVGRASVGILMRVATSSRATDILAAVWAAGVIVSLSILLVGLARLAWLAAHARRVARRRWLHIARDVSRDLDLHLRRPAQLLHSDHPSLLVTWGLFRPRVLLPASAAGWSEERLRIVLCHELAHIRRNDWIVQMAAALLRCVYWFNPLVWIACTRLRQESEMACDDAVLAQGVERADYATHVLDLARAAGQHRRTSVPAAAMASPSGLERRIRIMLNTRLDRAPLTRSARIAIVILLATITLPVAGFGALRQAAAAAALTGTLIDPTGAAVPDAEVALSPAGGGESRTTAVDARGRFTFAELPAGDYLLAVRAMGFATVQERVTLSPGQRAERRLALKIGSVQETITIARASSRGAQETTAERPAAQGAPARQAPASQSPAGQTTNRPPDLSSLRPPVKVYDVKPEYAQRLRDAGIHGTVTLQARIGVDGAVTGVEVVPPAQPELAAAAREAVLQWRYEPTRLHGVSVETPVTVTIEFVER